MDLETIRDRLISPVDGVQLYNRPYVVTRLEALTPVTEEGQQWCQFHHWDQLHHRIEALTAETDEGDRQLPSSQMHALRSSLFLGKDASDGQLRLIQTRYEEQGINTLVENGNSLFTQDPQTNMYCTHFLDALESVEFFASVEEGAS